MKCKICRTPFFSYGSRLCPQCQDQIDTDFVTVRDYIYDNPDAASVEKIAQATGVNEKSIIYMLEENRLTASGALASASGLRCQVCGRNINTGTVCESCKSALSKDLGAAANALDGKKSKGSSTMVRGSERDSRLISEYGKKK
ncbi:MAG: flagellar protein [Clostridiales bacterium]|nr:flagellar protein [Clostridiales bacterium]